MANWGSAFADNFQKGYALGTMIGDRLSASELADDLSKSDKESDEKLKTGTALNQKTYDDRVSALDSKYTYKDPAKLQSIEDRQAAAVDSENAGMEEGLRSYLTRPQFDENGKQLPAPSPEEVEKRIADAKALVAEEANQRKAEYREATAGDKAEAARYAEEKNSALGQLQSSNRALREKVNKERDDSRTKAYRSYYKKTGKADKLMEMDTIERFRSMVNDETAMNDYLLKDVNSRMANGEQIIQVDKNTLIRIDANGRQLGDAIPMPSMSARRQMLSNALAEQLIFSPDSKAAERGLKYAELQNNRTKLEAAAVKNASEIRKNNSQTALNEAKLNGTLPGGGGSGGGSGSGGALGAKYSIHKYAEATDPVLTNKGTIKAYTVTENETDRPIGTYFPDQNILAAPGKTLAQAQAERGVVEQATGQRATLVAFQDPETKMVTNVIKDNDTHKLYPSLAAYQQAMSSSNGKQVPQRALTSGEYKTRADAAFQKYFGSREAPTDKTESAPAIKRNLTEAEKEERSNLAAETASSAVDQFGSVDATAVPAEKSAYKDAAKRALNRGDLVGDTKAIFKPAVDKAGEIASDVKTTFSPLKRALKNISSDVEAVFKPLASVGKQSRGVQNKNPLNIINTSDKWEGKAGSDGKFVVFKTKDAGARACMKVLGANIKAVIKTGKGEFTITDLIERFAPKSDGNNTEAYAKTVAKDLGTTPSHKFDITNFDPETKQGKENIVALATAMAKVETGDVKAAKEYSKLFNKYAVEAFKGANNVRTASTGTALKNTVARKATAQEKALKALKSSK